LPVKGAQSLLKLEKHTRAVNFGPGKADCDWTDFVEQHAEKSSRSWITLENIGHRSH